MQHEIAFFDMKQQKTEIERPWSFLHVRMKPEQQIGVHQRKTWELSYVIRGCGERILDGNHSTFAEHDLVLVAPNIEHGWHFDPQQTDEQGMIECITLQWTTELLSQIELLFPSWGKIKESFLAIEQCSVFDAESSHCLVEKLLQLDSMDEERFPMVFLDLLLAILEQIPTSQQIERSTNHDRTEQRLRQVETYTSCNYARNIPLSDIAQHVGMNRSSFCSFFSRETGESYMTYLNRYRLKVARGLLEQSEYNVSTICWQCGFNDLGYFGRLFRKEFGVSPSEFRRQGFLP